MYKISVLLLLMAIAIVSQSQQTTPRPQLSKQDYLRKNREQRTTAWILLGGGTLALGGGIILARMANYFDDNTPAGSIIAMVAGGTAILASIPLFAAASENKKRAISISFGVDRAPQINRYCFSYSGIASVNLKIIL